MLILLVALKFYVDNDDSALFWGWVQSTCVALLVSWLLFDPVVIIVHNALKQKTREHMPNVVRHSRRKVVRV